MEPQDKFSDKEIAFIAAAREEQLLSWADVADKYNKKFKKDRNMEDVRKAYSRNRNILEDSSEYVKLFRDVVRTKKASSLNAKDFKKILEEWEKREEFLDAVKAAAINVSKTVIKAGPRKPKNKNKKGMTLELLISDVHVGKLTKTFNLEILKRRLTQIASTTIKEMDRAAEHYRIDRIIVAFLGDLIESATMHGTESAKGCEFGNSRQVQEALTHMFHLLFVPLCIAAERHGAKVTAVGITGNHDRTEHDRTYNQPGEENVTWIIYKTMEEFTKLAKLKNVEWHIPVEPYQYLEVYGEGILWEHYDNAKGPTRVALESLLSKRVNQLKKAIRFMRGGHFHDPVEYGIGQIITNGNVPGNDGYSTVLGFSCEPSQTLNFYIERQKTDSIQRQTSFYKRFLIQLD